MDQHHARALIVFNSDFGMKIATTDMILRLLHYGWNIELQNIKDCSFGGLEYASFTYEDLPPGTVPGDRIVH